jgi:WD40 repeat protein/Big-like domain-containing protein
LPFTVLRPSVASSVRAQLRFPACALALVAGALAAPLRAQTVGDVQVSPQTMTLAVGQKQTIFAAAFDRQGNLIPNARFTFWTSDSSVAKVQTDGTVLGVKPGLAKLEARVGNRRASLAVLVGGVGPAAGGTHGVAALTLEPASLRLVLGETAKLEPKGLKDDGTPAELGRVVWKSLRPDVVAVDSTGALLARGPGRSIIQAALASGMVATAPVEVETVDLALSESRVLLAPEGLDTLRLLVPSQANRQMTEGVVWQSTDTSVVRIGPAGIVQGVAPGTAEIVAWLSGQERRAAVVVHKPVRAIIVTPKPGGGPILIPLNRKHKFTVAAEAVDSTPIPDVRIGWEVGDTALAALDRATGELTAKALGTTSLTAKVPGFAPATWAIKIVPGMLKLDRARFALAPGDHATLVATLADDQGKAVGPAADLTWVSDRPEVATVDGQGAVEARGFGHAKLTATTSWGAAAATDVFVVGELLLVSNRGGRLGIYQASAAKPESLFAVLADSATNTEPAISPDRTRIAFSSNREGRGDYDLYAMDADGSHIQRLTTEAGTDGSPVWTPDGGKLVFTSARSGVPQIYLMPADSGDAQALTSSAGGNQSPAVSPDGRTIAFVSIRAGAPYIFRMALDGSGQTRATAGMLRQGVPQYFANGDLLYGEERSKGSREWRIMRKPDGAAPVALFQTEQPLVALSPSREGERVIFVTGKEAGKGKFEYRVWLRGLALGAQPVPLKLRPGEQVPTATF